MTVFEVTKSGESGDDSPFEDHPKDQLPHSKSSRTITADSGQGSTDMTESNSIDGSELGTKRQGNEMEGGRVNPCFITVENEHGELEHVELDIDDNQFTVHPNHIKPRGSVTSNGQFDAFPKLRRKPQPGQFEEEESAIVSPEVITELSRKAKKRLVAKSGRANVAMTNVPNRGRNLIKDVFTTCIDMQWRYVILAFSLSFLITWTVFGFLYWIIALIHGDFEEDNLPDGINQKSGNFTPCVWGIYNYASCYLFSLETQHTIGYGTRQTSEDCSSAIIVMSIQSIVGVLTSSSFAGIVFAKLARPKNRTHTVMFSKNAVITLRDGILYLVFRIGNVRKSHLIEAHVRAQLVHSKEVTKEGDRTYFSQQELKVSTMTEDEDDRVMLLLPTMIFHKIDADSPFYDMSPKDILNSKFEMVVSLEGIVEPTGNSVQARTSYLPREILWGYRFENMVSYSSKPGTYLVDCSYLNAVTQDDTPRMSMEKIYKEKRQEERRRRQSQMASVTSISEVGRKSPTRTDSISRFNPYASVIHADSSVTIQET